MSSSLADPIVTEILQLHAGIAEALRRSVTDAIRIGEILSQRKEVLRHGDFIPWIKGNLPFAEDTAERYIKLFVHADKIRSVRNLQEAYQAVASLETAEKQKERQAQTAKIEHVEKTGEKPKGWNRSDDYALKRKKNNDEFAERMKKTAAESKQEAAASREKREAADAYLKDLLARAHASIDASERARKKFGDHAKLALSGAEDGMEQDIIFGLLERYVEGFESNARQLEVVHNLIKKLKLMGTRLQQAAAAS